MNHTWSEDVTFFDKDEGVPQFQAQGNSSMLPQMMSTSSRDAALGGPSRVWLGAVPLAGLREGVNFPPGILCT